MIFKHSTNDVIFSVRDKTSFVFLQSSNCHILWHPKRSKTSRKLVSVPEWMLLAQKWFWPTVCFLRVGTTQIFIEPLQDTNWHISLRGAERCRALLYCYYKAAHPSDSSGQLWKRDLDASFLKGLNSIQVAISAISQDKALLLFQTLFHFRVCKEGTLTLGWLEFSTLDTNLSKIEFLSHRT